MACVHHKTHNADSEMEEGEIVDDLDDLSDISSEEEFLMRQRLQVLENYNNVLERKKAKCSLGPGVKFKHDPLLDLSEISATELDETYTITVYNNKDQKVKSHHKSKRKKEIERKSKDKKKAHSTKKKFEVKVQKDSSEESDDDYRNKRRKLADAVSVNKNKNDKSSLSDRLKKMLSKSDTHIIEKPIAIQQEVIDIPIKTDEYLEPVSFTIESAKMACPNKQNRFNEDIIVIQDNISETVDLCTEEIVDGDKINKDKIDIITGVSGNVKTSPDKDSDEDIEMLRQHALKSKSAKTKTIHEETNETDNKILSEDEDSDTAELRLICLKSALLKKAIEMKQKQKQRKKLSQSSNLQDELFNDQDIIPDNIDAENNTDTESVDMDIGSDGDDKVRDIDENPILHDTSEVLNDKQSSINRKHNPKSNVPREDELEDDEDLLRAKLLTSLSKNLPNLVNPIFFNDIDKVENIINKTEALLPKPDVKTSNVPPEKRIIINLGESDSEGEHEATKNLTKMHMKLSEQLDFQQKLDLFLKSARMEVEKTKLPDVVQKPIVAKKTEKFVAKTVKHLPKSEQIEYKNLVKRMAELEKIKQSRQSSMNIFSSSTLQNKETLKPRNVSLDSTKFVTNNNLEEKITISRKRIAAESAKMMKLKEEANKLSQKYKIAATELRNITTAITLNKKQQKSVQTSLSKIRLQHQMLLKSTSVHSNSNSNLQSFNLLSNKSNSTSKLQKENDPTKEEYKNTQMLRSLKVSVVNDLKDDAVVFNPRLSIQVDVSNNNKVVKLPKSPIPEERHGDIDQFSSSCRHSNPIEEKGGGTNHDNIDTNPKKKYEGDDYISPLQSLGTTTWEADPNAILCPFDVGGSCKDPDCKYLHTQKHTH